MRGPPLRPTLLIAALLGVTGCRGLSDEPARETIESSVFVATYVDLRAAALRSGGTVEPTRRSAILAEHGVTEEDLLEFAEVHGRDAALMRDVWAEVERRLDSLRTAASGGDPAR